MTEITNKANEDIIVKTKEQIKDERKEKLKEYRRNYYREYYKRNPEKKQQNLDLKASNNRRRYEEDEEYRKKQIGYSKIYRARVKKEKEDLNEKLEKLNMLENLLKDNIDFKNSNILVKV